MESSVKQLKEEVVFVGEESTAISQSLGSSYSSYKSSITSNDSYQVYGGGKLDIGTIPPLEEVPVLSEGCRDWNEEFQTALDVRLL